MFPIVDLNGPTKLAFHLGWLLSTLANFLVIVLVVLVFLVGVTVRVPGVKRALRKAESDSSARPPVPVTAGTAASGPASGGEEGNS